MGLLNVVKRALTWWGGQTLNTQLWTWRHGIKVGEDEMGNVFYRDAADKRRWVIYKEDAEASKVGPEWHGWLHHTWDESPTIRPLAHKPWEKPHVENLTGTAMAYVPPGSIRRAEPVARSDYEAWQPE